MSTPVPPTIDASAFPASAPHHSAVVSILSPPLTSYTFPPLPQKHLYIPLNDTTTASLLFTLPESISFIHKHHSDSILVHCLNGRSRSAATVVAYLLYVTSAPSAPSPPYHRLQTALQTLRARFPCADPSPSFLRQLAAFVERNVHPPHQYHFPSDDVTYRAKAGPLETTEISLALSVAWPTISPRSPDALPWHSLLLPNPQREHIGMRCRKCRAPLVHRDGRIKGGGTESGSVVHVWATRWMGACISAEEGRLKCWTCRRKVGGYRREGAESRGSEFWITDSAVDFVL